MKFELVVNEEVFVNDKGEKIPYFSCVANVGGAPIRFSVKKEDKALLKFMISKQTNGGK